MDLDLTMIVFFVSHPNAVNFFFDAAIQPNIIPNAKKYIFSENDHQEQSRLRLIHRSCDKYNSILAQAGSCKFEYRLCKKDPDSQSKLLMNAL